jgi:hypothetical protein
MTLPPGTTDPASHCALFSVRVLVLYSQRLALTGLPVRYHLHASMLHCADDVGVLPLGVLLDMLGQVSSISVCRGPGCFDAVPGLTYMSWRAPW